MRRNGLHIQVPRPCPPFLTLKDLAYRSEYGPKDDPYIKSRWLLILSTIAQRAGESARRHQRHANTDVLLSPLFASVPLSSCGVEDGHWRWGQDVAVAAGRT